MNAEIITVGTELLLGDILNTNTQYLSKKLREVGINVYNHQSVGDNKDRLKDALKLSLDRSDVVITVAGLGPTDDDITCETVCNTFGVPMVYHPEIEEEIRKYFEVRHKEMPESNIKQAVLPEGATILHNKVGTAPGSIINLENGKCVMMFPGPPAELKSMFESAEVQEKLKQYSNGKIVSQTIHVIGMGESEVAEKISEFLNLENPTVATYCKNGEVEIKITSSGASDTAINWLINPIIQKIVQKLGYKIYGFGETDLQTELVKKLRAQKISIATAESCTAGNLSKTITDVAGASEIFEMGVTTYSGDKKNKLLGVSKNTLAKFGEVSPEVSREMAVGILDKSGADIGVGITGIAGPDGGTPEKPVGLVYISVADSKFVYTGMLRLGNRGRDFVREVAVKSALDMVRRAVMGFEMTLGRPVPTEVIEAKLDNGKSTANAYIPPVVSIPTPVFSPAPSIIPTQVTETEDDFVDINSGAEPGFLTRQEIAQKYIEKPQQEEKPHMTPAESYRAFVNGEDDDTDYLDLGKDNNQEKNSFIKETKKEEKAKKEKDNRPWYLKLLFWFIPTKSDDLLGKIIKIFRTVCIIALIVCLILIGSYYLDLWKSNSGDDRARNLHGDAEGTGQNGILASLQGLYDLNNDLVGYLTIDGKGTNGKKLDLTGPVVQAKDNDYYLSHDFYKNSNRFGARFADSANVFSPDGTLSQNTIIYGHFTDDGEIFGGLYNFEDLDFYKEHSTIEFETLYQKTQWKVFAVFITNTHEEHDNGYVFPYRTLEFADQNAFLNFTTELEHRSMIITNVDVVEGDRLLTLSTCSRKFKDARFVVVARQVREGEDPNVDLTQVSVNPMPLYPDIWYREVDRNAVKPVFDQIINTETTETTTMPTTALTSETTTETTTVATVPSAIPYSVPTPQQPVTVAPQTQPTVQPTTQATTKQTTTKKKKQPTTKATTTTKEQATIHFTTRATTTATAAQDANE